MTMRLSRTVSLTTDPAVPFDDLAVFEHSLSSVESDVKDLKAYLYSNQLTHSSKGQSFITALRARIDRLRAANKEIKDKICTVRLQNVEMRKSIKRRSRLRTKRKRRSNLLTNHLISHLCSFYEQI